MPTIVYKGLSDFSSSEIVERCRKEIDRLRKRFVLDSYISDPERYMSNMMSYYRDGYNYGDSMIDSEIYQIVESDRVKTTSNICKNIDLLSNLSVSGLSRFLINTLSPGSKKMMYEPTKGLVYVPIKTIPIFLRSGASLDIYSEEDLISFLGSKDYNKYLYLGGGEKGISEIITESFNLSKNIAIRF